jgi:acetyl-CoA carboxylase carboxyl transferase subunit beta
MTRLLRMSARRQPTPSPETAEAVIRDPGRLPERDAWEVVSLARRLRRPTTLDSLAYGLDDFLELHGDRLGGDCPAVVAGLGLLDTMPLVVIGTQKGHSATELNARGFGMATPAGYRKAARLMRLAAKLGLPVVTLIDTPGAYPGLAAEEHGQAMAIAENIRLMSGLPVPIVAVITGEGGSGGALALAVADRVLILANGIYSVISPEGCASILWKDTAAAPAAARALRLDARELLRLGIVDGVIAEPGEGADTDPAEAALRLRAALSAELGSLMTRAADRLVAGRYERFRAFGVPADREDPRVADVVRVGR